MRREMQQKNNEKKIVISVLGIPGSGKTTQIKKIREIINPDVFHIGKIAKEVGYGEKDLEIRNQGGLLEGYDDVLFDRLKKSKNAFVILDGFPRNLKQAESLLKETKKNNWILKVVNLDLGQDFEKKSIERQLKRVEENQDKEEKTERIKAKAKRFLEEDKKAIDFLKEKEVDFLEVDAELGIEEIHQKIFEFLDLNKIFSLNFDLDILEKVKNIEAKTDVELWPGAGLFYRPFFNPNFGPCRDSFDKDVHSYLKEEIIAVLTELKKDYPDVRWSVDSRFEDVEKIYNLKSPSFQEAMFTFPLTYRQGGVKILENGKLSILISSKALYALENGVVEIDYDLLNKFKDETDKEKFIQRALARSFKIVQEYPGLKLDEFLSKLFFEKYGYKPGIKIEKDFKKIEKTVRRNEDGGRILWRAESINSEQKEIMEEILDFYRKSPRLKEKVEYPKLGKLEKQFEERLNRKQNLETKGELKNDDWIFEKEFNIPEKFRNVMEYFFSLPDTEFREWFYNQVRSRKPFGGKNKELFYFIDYVNEREKAESNVDLEQKPTHLGTKLVTHLIDIAGLIETDSLREIFKKYNYSEREIEKNIFAIRSAALIHDIGKMNDVFRPGGHQYEGVKIWEKIKPDWIDEDEANLISWIILSHDVFGRLGRSISEKKDYDLYDEDFDVLAQSSYGASTDPKDIVKVLRRNPLNNDELALEIIFKVWSADATSVSFLRWLLPIAPKLKKLVEVEFQKKF